MTSGAWGPVRRVEALFQTLTGSGLRGRLLRSHLTLTGMGVGLFLIALGAIFWLRASALRLATVREPTARASTRALGGTQRSLAEMRGWVTLGDRAFKHGRTVAWSDEIRPAMRELKQLSHQWRNAQDVVRLAALEKLLDDLEESQWWIEDVAQTPGNKPARSVLVRRIRPVGQAVMTATSAMIDTEKQQPVAKERRGLLESMTDFQGLFAASQTSLANFVRDGTPEDEEEFRRILRAATGRFRQFSARAYLLTEAQRELLGWLKEQFPAFEPLANDAISLRKTNEWNVAQHRLSAETDPLARQITGLLADMAGSQTELTRQDVRLVSRISNAAMILSVVLFLAMAVAAPVLSVRRAARIAEPIGALARATEELAAGRLKEDIVASGEKELRQLTRSFNRMRAAIQKAEGALVKQAQELARSNAELDDFAYIASHDLKEPLRGIHNYSSFLLEDYGDKLDDDGHRMLQTLMRLTQRMENLIETLLYYSRVGRLDLATSDTDLGAVLAEVLDSLQVGIEEEEVEIRVPAPLPTLRCDRARVGEIFRNLITNAAKYNDKPEKWVEIGYHNAAPAGGVPPVFYVRDNGIGIRPKHQESIFRIFKRLHGRDKFGGGAGAGLTIVKKIVERHGGRIWVESEEGVGTTFYFTLQRESDEPATHIGG